MENKKDITYIRLELNTKQFEKLQRYKNKKDIKQNMQAFYTMLNDLKI